MTVSNLAAVSGWSSRPQPGGRPGARMIRSRCPMRVPAVQGLDPRLSLSGSPGRSRKYEPAHLVRVALFEQAACDPVELAPGGADVIEDEDAAALGNRWVWDLQDAAQLGRRGAFSRCGPPGCASSQPTSRRRPPTRPIGRRTIPTWADALPYCGGSITLPSPTSGRPCPRPCRPHQACRTPS